MYGCAFDKMKLFYLVLTNARSFFCNEKWKRRRNSQNGIMGKNLSKLIQKSITRKECNPIKCLWSFLKNRLCLKELKLAFVIVWQFLSGQICLIFHTNTHRHTAKGINDEHILVSWDLQT